MIGMVYRELRLAKGISQKEVYLGIVSKSFFQKFEKGQHSITVEKFQLLLKRIFFTYEEFMYYYNKKKIDDNDLITEIFSAYWEEDYVKLLQIYNTNKYSNDKTIQFYSRIALLFNEIIKKNNLTKDKYQFIIEHLISLKEWSLFEVKIYNCINPIVPKNLKNSFFLLAKQFFIQNIYFVRYNSEVINWYSYIYFSHIEYLLTEKNFQLAETLLTEFKLEKEIYFTNERAELSYMFINNLYNLYISENTEQVIENLHSLLILIKLVNKKTFITYSLCLNKHILLRNG